jgi:hypothetical protein
MIAESDAGVAVPGPVRPAAASVRPISLPSARPFQFISYPELQEQMRRDPRKQNPH